VFANRRGSCRHTRALFEWAGKETAGVDIFPSTARQRSSSIGMSFNRPGLLNNRNTMFEKNPAGQKVQRFGTLMSRITVSK